MTKREIAVLAIAFTALHNAGLLAQSRHRDLPRGFRSIAGVTLNRDSAASIRTKLGNTREQDAGEGRDRYASWCYQLAGADSATLLELMSDNSDMGADGQELNVIRLRATAPSKEREGCASLQASATVGGLRLGLTRSDVQKLLGRPKRVAGDSLIYDFEAKEFMRPGSPEYRAWNTPEYRRSCFEGGPPYASVGGIAIVILRDQRTSEIRVERYDQSTC